MRRYSSWAGIVAVLAAAFIFDRWVTLARSAAVARLSVTAYQWTLLAANLLFAVAVLWLASQLLSRSSVIGRGPAVACLLAGLALAFLPSPALWAFGAGMPSDLVTLMRASPHSFVGQSAAFLVVLGGASLAFRRQ